MSASRRLLPQSVLALLVALAGCSSNSTADATQDATHLGAAERRSRVEAPPLPADLQALKDINPLKRGANPNNLAVVNGALFFAADDGANGTELWKSDGTEAGTVRVKDVTAGPNGSVIERLTDVNGTVYFSYATQFSGSRELWKSDGTEAGTVRVKSLGPVGFEVSAMTGLNGAAIFRFSSNTLWRSDGTEAGTIALASPGGVGTTSPIVVANGIAFVVLGDDTAGLELWKTDGTAAGTARVKDINPGTGNSLPNPITAVGGQVYFGVEAGTAARPQLWKSDGTDAGTVLVRDRAQVSHLTLAGTTLFMTGTVNAQDGLYKVDTATDAVTQLISGAELSVKPVAVGSTLYFARSDAAGLELWKSDGTAGGTVRVADLRAGASGSSPSGLTAVGSTLYFVADDGTRGAELWKSDGTAAGTVLVAELTPGATGSVVREPIAVGSNLFFAALSPLGGVELWKSDGTAPGTATVKDINAQPASGPSELEPVVIGRTAYFLADDGVQGLGLWKSDGTTAGTVRVKALRSASDGTVGTFLLPVGTRVVFGTGEPSSSGNPGALTVWASDGTEAGTVALQTWPGASVGSFATTGTTAYFTVNNYELWKTNGTVGGTSMVKQLAATRISGRYGMAAVGSQVLFFAHAGTNYPKLWRSDGTNAGTVIVRPDVEFNPRSLTVVNGRLFFVTEKYAQYPSLWTSDGTEAGTLELLDQLYFRELANVNGKLFFICAGTQGEDRIYNDAVWTSDGTVAGTALVLDLPGWSLGAGDSLDGVYYFLLDSRATSSRGLWRSDGTAAGTRRVANMGPLNLPSFWTRHGALFFSGQSTAEGRELWKSDGTAAGTSLFADLNPGTGDSSPRGLVKVNGRLLFFADDGVHGSEPWALALSPVVCGTASAEATGPSGAQVSFEAKLAEDVDPATAITYSTPSGGTFALGVTPITVSASDPAYPLGACTLNVNVVDTTPPALTCPASQVVEADSPDGAAGVALSGATATDVVTASPQVSYSPASGGTFRLGDTAVTASASDTAGNVSRCTFPVSVRDTTPPQLTCPDITQNTDASGAAQVFYHSVTATDAVTRNPALQFDTPSGALFEVGSTVVLGKATDLAGNEATCTFTVTVRKSGCGCGATSTAGGLGWLAALLVPLLLRRAVRRAV
jgi:ELWxxDGT repeat protein